MNKNEKIQTILFIRPNAVFYTNNDELIWLDENQTQPTEAEINAGWVDYQAAQQAEAEAKAQTKAELLERLGITADEAKLLLA
jgi:hypothetical protein